MLMLGEEMKSTSQGTGLLTDQGKERGRGFAFSTNTVITLVLWTLIWECGGSLTLYYNSMVTLG